jgi:hypothetical protein
VPKESQVDIVSTPFLVNEVCYQDLLANSMCLKMALKFHMSGLGRSTSDRVQFIMLRNLKLNCVLLRTTSHVQYSLHCIPEFDPFTIRMPCHHEFTWFEVK